MLRAPLLTPIKTKYMCVHVSVGLQWLAWVVINPTSLKGDSALIPEFDHPLLQSLPTPSQNHTQTLLIESKFHSLTWILSFVLTVPFCRAEAVINKPSFTVC